MMFADLVDLEDLTSQLNEVGISVSSDANPEAINQATAEWLNSATPEQIKSVLGVLNEFQQASEGLILPAAKTVLESLLEEISGH